MKLRTDSGHEFMILDQEPAQPHAWSCLVSVPKPLRFFSTLLCNVFFLSLVQRAASGHQLPHLHYGVPKPRGL